MNKILQKLKQVFLFTALIILSVSTSAQEKQLLAWQFLTSGTGTNGNSLGDEVSYTSTSNHAVASTSTLSRGAGLRKYALGRSFASTPNVLTPNQAAAITSNAYYEFSFKPSNNYKISLTKLDVKLRTSGTWSANANATPLYWIWKYSVDNGNSFTDIGLPTAFATVAQDARQPSLSLSGIADLQNLPETTTAIFRLYVWGFTNAVGAGTFSIGRSTDTDDVSLALSGKSQYLGDVTTEVSEAYFTDSKTIAKGGTSNVIMDKLISMINNTPVGESIHVAIYMINHTGVMDALKAAETRGVNLHIIVDMSRADSQGTNATSLPWLQTNLQNSEIIVSESDVSPNAINHHKFALFSKVQTPEGVLQNATFQTSHNFTNADAKKIQDALVFNNTAIYQAFLTNWNSIKANASSGMRANFNYNAYAIPSINAKLEFFPRIVGGVHDGEDNIVNHLNAITDVANSKIRIAMSDWSDSRPATVDKLIALRNQGATIEVYVKDAAGTQIKAKLRQLEALGATLRIFNLEEGGDAKFNIHAKMMIIEGNYDGQANAKVIITGSHNYTDGALKTNNEVLVTLVNSALFATYSTYFEALKTIVPAVKLLAFNMTDNVSTPRPVTTTSTFAVGIQPSVMSRGAGLSIGGLAQGFLSSKTDAGSTAADFAAALTRNDYFEIPVKVRPGKKISLTNISAIIRRTGGGGQKIQWVYVLDNGTPTPLGTEILVPATSNGTPVDELAINNVPALQNLTSQNDLKIRLYMYGETAPGGTFAFGQSSTENPEVFVLSGDLETISDDNVILAWTAGGLANETPSLVAKYVSAKVTPATLSRGAGLEASSLSSGFSSRTNAAVQYADVTDFATAQSKQSYIEFAFNVKANTKVSLATLQSKMRRSGAGATNFTWAYSLDGNHFININDTPTGFSSSLTTGVYQAPLDLSQVAALQNISAATTVTFRVYAWGFTSVNGSLAFGLSESLSEDVLLLTGSASTLPVTLTKFEAKKNNQSVLLSWSTIAEQNNSHFEVLKSVDGKNWVKLASINGAGTSNQKVAYQQADFSPANGINYYQLKQVDFDGKSTTFETVSVLFSLEKTAGIAVSHKSQHLTVFANGFAKGDAKLVVYNLSGQAMISVVTMLQNGANQFRVAANLTKGLYVLTLFAGKEKKSIKFVVEN